MASKLDIYNASLAYLGSRQIASLTENREPRRVLDSFYAKAVAYCLERRFWNFGYRTIEANASTTVTPQFGYLYAFAIPSDWIRTRKFSSVPTLDPPLIQMSEQAGYWYANITPVYVEYTSSDNSYGGNLGLWPESFADYVAARLARLACPRITDSQAKLIGPNGLIAEEMRAYKIANANCAMNEAVGFAPQSSWVRARRGFVRGLPAPGGDEPSGGVLIP